MIFQPIHSSPLPPDKNGVLLRFLSSNSIDVFVAKRIQISGKKNLGIFGQTDSRCKKEFLGTDVCDALKHELK